MLHTIEVEIDAQGAIRPLQPLPNAWERRALLTLVALEQPDVKSMVKDADLDASKAGQRQRLGFLAGHIIVPDDFDRLGDEAIERLLDDEA